ncbi:MAG: cupin domain-containing protein, partial [Alphaproteobacteria bacterium]
YHLHHKLEEMFFILEGNGTLRYNGEEYPIKKGDVIACPPGPGGAHQIINTGKAEMKYLSVSNSGGPEVAEYPDSGKVGIMCGPWENPDLRLIVKNDGGIGYFDGESD